MDGAEHPPLPAPGPRHTLEALSAMPSWDWGATRHEAPGHGPLLACILTGTSSHQPRSPAHAAQLSRLPLSRRN